MKTTINWALAGTGGITNSFAQGLRLAEGASLYAVSSRTKDKAEKFAARHGVQKAFADYGAMLADPKVDAVYIGVPHSAHCELALQALDAGKAVLCEKPAAINAAELRRMIDKARDKKLFFMEAMWARFVPPVVKAREWLADGLIGDLRMAQGNFCFKVDLPPEHRLLAPALGGGALLDAGVYPLSFASMAFGGVKPEKVSGTMTMGTTGVDEHTAAILGYGAGKTAMISAALSFAAVNDMWFYGTAGHIHLPSFVWAHSANLALAGKPVYHWEGDFRGNGYNYEAEAVMDCLREGRLESAVMPLAESLVIAETMDEIRRQCGFRYPKE
jgi:predicted dehydrogenase